MSVSRAARAQTSEWLTAQQACALIGVSPATLRRWSDAGAIRTFTTPGGHRRFARSAILGLLPAAARERRPKLERLGETPEHMMRVYRRHLDETCRGTPWIGGLGEDELASLRDHGRRIARSLLRFIDATTPAERESAIEDGVRSAAECGRIAALREVAMSQAVEAFLRFRLPFLGELAALARRRGLDTAEATDLLETATEATDLLLSSLMGGHATAAARPSPDEVITR